jgi:hypothetical protein
MSRRPTPNEVAEMQHGAARASRAGAIASANAAAVRALAAARRELAQRSVGGDTRAL